MIRLRKEFVGATAINLSLFQAQSTHLTLPSPASFQPFQAPSCPLCDPTCGSRIPVSTAAQIPMSTAAQIATYYFQLWPACIVTHVNFCYNQKAVFAPRSLVLSCLQDWVARLKYCAHVHENMSHWVDMQRIAKDCYSCQITTQRCYTSRIATFPFAPPSPVVG